MNRPLFFIACFSGFFLLQFHFPAFAQQNHVTSPDGQQVEVAQQKGVPQVSVIRYDTVRITNPKYPNRQQIKIYSSTGRLIKSGDLLNGKKEGVWRSYYENGMLSRLEEYHEDQLNGVAVGIEVNGMVSEEYTMKNGLKNGIEHQYNRTGTMKLEENYLNGLLNGERRVFGQDGKLVEEGFWKNGRRDSINRWAYPSGKVYVEYNYHDGNVNGPGKTYYESGRVKASGNFVDGYEQGPWKEYSDSTGKVTAEGNYTAGKKTGKWKIYDDHGNPKQSVTYDANGDETGNAGTNKKKKK